MVGTLASPSSPRHKSFAQHLLEIEQEAAKAASRCRWAHSKTALAFEQPPTSFSGQVPSLAEPASPVPHGADTAAARRASAAERDRERYACELRVLRRTIPELEEALAARDSLLQASLSQQQALARGRAQQDTAMDELQHSLQQAMADAAGLRETSQKQARQLAQQEREIARLEAEASSAPRQQGGGAHSASTSPVTPSTPAGRRPPMVPLTPPSALLAGIDEESATGQQRSRGAAYWRRAQLAFRVASIADYWQAQAKASNPRFEPPVPGTPWPGTKMQNHKMQSFRAARDGSLEPQTPGTPQGGGTSQEGTAPQEARTPHGDSPAGKAAAAESALAALLSVAKRKLDDAVQMAVASALLGLDLAEGPRPTQPRQEEAAQRAAQQAAEGLDLPLEPSAAKGLSGLNPEEATAALRRWGQETAALRMGACTGAALRQAAQQGRAAATAVAAAAGVVIEKNMPPLEEHLRTIQHDGCAAAVRALRAAKATRREACAPKATAVIASLDAAVDNVVQQFTSGLRASVPASVTAQAGPLLVQRLCSQAVLARTTRLREQHSEELVTTRLWEELSLATKLQQTLSGVGEQAWLFELLKGSASLELPPPLLDFLTAHIARHLDPYVDGEVTSPANERGSSPLLPWLQARYAEEHGGAHLPVPTELVLAQHTRGYVVHAIARSNTTHCFGELLMGQGRLPVAPYEQDAHFAALGKALNVAVLRDFGPEHCTIQGLPVGAALVEQMAREHSRLLFLQQQILGNHLAEANRLGEVGRKDEMKRIFNIDM